MFQVLRIYKMGKFRSSSCCKKSRNCKQNPVNEIYISNRIEGSPGCPQPLTIYPIDPPKEVKIKLIVHNIDKKVIGIICFKLRISTEPFPGLGFWMRQRIREIQKFLFSLTISKIRYGVMKTPYIRSFFSFYPV